MVYFLFVIMLGFAGYLPAAEIPANTHVLVRAVIVHNDHVLCAYDPNLNGQPLFYHLPGGHLQYNVDAKECLQMHLQKHFDLEVEVAHCTGAFERSWDTAPYSITCHKHEVTLVFVAHLKHDVDIQNPIVSKKPNAFCFTWIPLSQIDSLDIRPHVMADMLSNWHSNANTFFAGEMHIVQ